MPSINADVKAPAKEVDNLEVYDNAGNAEKKEGADTKVQDEAAAAKAQEAPDYPISQVKGMFVINEVYRYLGVIASFVMCLSHGANDVANAISPLLAVQQTRAVYLGESSTGKLGYWVGGIGIVAGIILLGERVMITVGKKMVRLTYVVDFCSQMSTAIIVICKSFLGLPVSTTHCMVGAILGIYLARKIPFINYAYCTDEQKEEAKKYLEETGDKKGSAEYGLDKKLFAKIFGWWVATVPAAFCLAGFIAWIISLFTK